MYNKIKVNNNFPLTNYLIVSQEPMYIAYSEHCVQRSIFPFTLSQEPYSGSKIELRESVLLNM